MAEAKYDGFVKIQSLNENIITAESSHNLLVQRPRTNLGDILGKNVLLNKWVRPMYKLAKLVTETNGKVQEPKNYDEVIDNLIHENRWQKIINENFRIWIPTKFGAISLYL